MPGMPGMPGMPEMRDGMGRDGSDMDARMRRRGPASTLLGMRTRLLLSEDQVKRLEVLQSTPAPQRNEADMLRARADLMDATRGDGNLAGARAALDKMSRLRNDQMLAGIKASQDARNVLTTAQKSQMDQLREAMRERGMQERGMRERGMRERGMRTRDMR